MKRIGKKTIKRIACRAVLMSVALLPVLSSCAGYQEEPDGAVPGAKGVKAFVDVKLGDVEVGTRATNYDNWSKVTFNAGDKAGLYSLAGMQNPDDPDDFTLPIVNGEMAYEGKFGSNYRFGNSEIVIDPSSVNKKYSTMYYPYYKDMPLPTDASTLRGAPLRAVDPSDGIEKGVDFMHTKNNNLTLTNGALNPTFGHDMFSLVIQRGNGFDEAKDERIWVVMKKPYTDMRVKQTSATSTYTYLMQYVPEEENEEDLMIDIVEGESKFKVNKYCVWEAWEGMAYKAERAFYAVLPPEEVYFIFMQDNYGNWQNVSDFYLSSSSSKKGTAGQRYILHVELQGVDVVVRPVSVVNWDDEVVITDNRKKGMGDYQEYNRWAMLYNSYIESNRSESFNEELMEYGDGVLNTVTGRTSWTFYINGEITFPNSEFSQVRILDDILEGSSTYTNYNITNIKGPFIGEMTSEGVLRAVEFNDIYLVQDPDAEEPFGALVGTLNGGTIENVNVNNGIIISSQPAGMVAGSVNGGIVRDCTFSGDVIGTASEQNGLFGVVTAEPTVRRNNTAGLKFILN